MISGKRLDNLIDHYIGPGELFEDTRKALRELKELRKETVQSFEDFQQAMIQYAKEVQGSNYQGDDYYLDECFLDYYEDEFSPEDAVDSDMSHWDG